MPGSATVAMPAAATSRTVPRRAFLIAPVLAAALVLIATRHDPLLSPDSITYLSVAEHIRDGHGLTDFTTKPLSVFGPVYPLLLAPGGDSLVWATIVGAASIAAVTTLMWLLLRRRVRPLVAIAGALALGCSQGLVHIASLVWSETPYAAFSLAVFVVLQRREVTNRVAALSGLLAGLGFLTRYAGAGLLLSGAVAVAASVWPDQRREVGRRLLSFGAAAAAVVGTWIIRNLVETGEALGPRFNGGAPERVTATVRLAFIGTGHIVAGDDWSVTAQARIGAGVVVLLAVLAVAVLRSRGATAVDLGMAALAVTSFVIPIVSRMITANDIEFRVMSPMLIPLVYFAAVTVDHRCTRPVLAVACTAVLGWWLYLGATFAVHFPDQAPTGSGYKPQFSPQLYDAVDVLPAPATILTNNPQRVWWFTRREPTVMGFTRPRPGNSHYPLDLDDTLEAACSGDAYLAWFDSLQNGGAGPSERRPDLAAAVDLQLLTNVPGGQLYHLAPRDPDACRPPPGTAAGQG